MINLDLNEVLEKVEEKIKNDDFPIRKAVLLDHANYFGLILGKQIMFCTHNPALGRQLSYSLLLPTLRSHNQTYQYAPEGERFVEKCKHDIGTSNPDKHSSYIASIKLVKPAKNSKAFCETLYKNGYFPFWTPETTYNFINKENSWIAISRVCKIDKVNVNRAKDISGGRDNRTIKNEKIIIELALKQNNKTSILDIDTFTKKGDSIIRIISDENN